MVGGYSSAQAEDVGGAFASIDSLGVLQPVLSLAMPTSRADDGGNR